MQPCLFFVANAKNTTEMRQEYNTFQRIVKQILDAEVISQDELGAYMYLIYDALKGDDTPENKKYQVYFYFFYLYDNEYFH